VFFIHDLKSTALKSFCLTFATIFLLSQAHSQEFTRTFKIEKNYINIPISAKTPRQKVVFSGVPEIATFSQIKIADTVPDYWVFKDVSRWKGSTITLQFSKKVKGLDMIYQSDVIAGQDSLYRESMRPQVHFSTKRGWINDPNGLIYHNGEYHLFYQHNPYEWEWENMHWGHAVSKDLVYWTELPDALYPDSLGTMFSGSAIIDKNNDAGWGKNAMVFFYTAAGKKMSQNIAYSLDNGKTFKKYENNPILGPDRDPKVFWHEASKNWVLVVYNVNYNEIYNSKDLKHWTYKSRVDGFYECPDLFELAVDGDPNHKKWIMYGASGTYMIGSFDGANFIPEGGKYMYTSGSLYAAQTFSNIQDGRTLQIGWGRIPHPGMPFNNIMLFPNELTLKKTPQGLRMYCRPAKEISLLHNQKHEWKNVSVDELNKELSTIKGDLFHGVLDFEMDKGLGMELHYRGLPIVYYDGNYNSFNHINYINDDPKSFRFTVEFIIDRTSVEAYMDNGKLFISEALKFKSNEGLKLVGGIKIHSFQLYELNSIW
jgi:fructan beta-fructosidase